MKIKRVEGLCKVIVENGTQFITMPDGTIIPNQIMSRVLNNYDLSKSNHVYTEVLLKLRAELINTPNE